MDQSATKGRIREHFAGAARGVRWCSPSEAATLLDEGGLVIDVRSDLQRRQLGEIPGALVIGRQLVAWRLHPASPCRHPWIEGHDQRLVVVADGRDDAVEIVAGLGELGLTGVAGLRGGFEAWSAAGLPVRQYVHAC